MEFNKYVKVREEKFGSVIFETLKEKVFVTNDTGKEILGLLQGGNSAQESIEILSKAYPNQNRDTIKKDVEDFVAALKEKNIIS